MKTPLGLTAATLALLLVACGDSAPPAAAPSSTSGGNPVTAPVDYLGAVAKAKKTAEGGIDVAALKKAIDAFSVDEGRLPKDLDELVTKQQLPKLPDPPYNMKFEYDAKTGNVKVVPK
jgi:hypothetical protein